MRKVLSFVLVLALVLSSFSMAFAADDAVTTAAAVTSASLSDIDGNTNESAIVVCNNLGIITGNPDGTYQPEKDVNRAEFSAMITRALGIPESALAGYTNTSFKDTTGYGWAVPYIAFCESKGIMLGDGQGNAMPGKTITVNEAVTMVLRAVGYTANSAELVGVWPSNYVTKAQDLGIYDDVATTTTVNKANAAQIIYNALTVQKVQVNSDGQTNGVYNGTAALGNEVNMLNSGLNCTVENGGLPMIVVYEADALVNVRAHVGEYAKVYKNSDDEIVAIDGIESTVLTGTFSAAPGFGGAPAAVTFTSNDVDYNLKATTNVSDAGRADQNWAYNEFVNCDDTAIPAYVNDDVTYTIHVKLSGKNITDWYSTVYYDANQEGQLTADDLADIKDGKLFGEDFDTDKDDNIIENSYALVGAKALDELKTDNIVYVYTDGDYITKVTVGTKVVEGTAKKVSSDGKEVTVDGTKYEFASDNVNGINGEAQPGDIEAGDVVKMWLDAEGYIYDFEETDSSADNFAVVINYADDVDKYASATPYIKLFLADGTNKEYEIDSDVADTVASVAALNVTAGSIVKYGLDKDGVVDALEACTMTPQVSADKELKEAGYYNGLEVKSDAVYFTAEVTNFAAAIGGADYQDKDNYDVSSFDALKTLEFKARYVLDDNGRIEAMLVDADATSSTDTYGVITDKFTDTDEDGDTVYMLTALVGGAEKDYEATKTLYNGFSLTNDTDELYLFGFNASNEVNELTAVSWTSVAAGHAGTVSTSGTAITSANAISLNGKVITISDAAVASNVLANNSGQTAKITVSSDVIVYIWNADDAVFEVKSLNNLKNKVNAENASNLLFFVTDDEDSDVPGIVIWK